jgi:hypothetical protein
MLMAVMFLWGYQSQALAQPNDTARNAVYFELFGNGAVYSINYERLFSPSFSGRIGASYAPYILGTVFVTRLGRLLTK